MALARQYSAHGLNMLSRHAQFPEVGLGRGRADGDVDPCSRPLQGVFDALPWFEEFRLYHRKDGQVVKLRDDLMAATRYGVMMLREAVVDPAEFKGGETADGAE